MPTDPDINQRQSIMTKIKYDIQKLKTDCRKIEKDTTLISSEQASR